MSTYMHKHITIWFADNINLTSMTKILLLEGVLVYLTFQAGTLIEAYQDSSLIYLMNIFAQLAKLGQLYTN